MPSTSDYAVLETLEEVRLLGNEDRVRVLRRLTEGAFTGAQLARDLDMPGTRIHYHLKQLEAGGLIAQERTGRKLWKEERYFVATARQFLVDPRLTCTDAGTAQKLLHTFQLAADEWRRREILEVDLARVAERIVEGALRVRAGERVFVMFGPDTDELAEAVVVELEARGAYPLPKFWSRNYILRTLDRNSDEELARLPFMAPEEVETLDAGVFVHSSFAQGAPPNEAQRAKLPHMMESVAVWQRSLLEHRVRYVELAPVQRGEIATNLCSVERATELFWKLLVREHEDLEARWEHFAADLPDGALLELEDARGTSLRVPVEPAAVRVIDGRISSRDVERGATYEHLPAGFLVLLPRPRAASGVLHLESSFWGRHHFEDVRIRIEDGRIAEFDAASNADVLRNYFEIGVGDGDVLSYLGVGLDPVARESAEGDVLTGKPLLDSCFAGVLTAGFGRNVLYGGDVRSTFGLDVCGRGATVRLGGRPLLVDGEPTL